MRSRLALSCLAICGSVFGCELPGRAARDPDQNPDSTARDVFPASPLDAGRDLDAATAHVPPTRVPVDWVRIEGGSFMMGPDLLDNSDGFQEPAFRVQVPAFDLMRTEVSVADYGRCVLGGQCRPRVEGTNPENPSCADKYRTTGDALPVDCVDWEDAEAYARWVGGEARLPTQAEWEFAARGRGQGWTFPWGDDAPTCDRAIVAVYSSPEAPVENGCGRDSPWPPCSRPGGNSPEGICDLVGNVAEWTEDKFRPDTTACIPNDGSPCVWPAGLGHVVRGCDYSTPPNHCVPQIRSFSGRASRGIGFRLARPVAPDSWRRPVE